VRRIGIDEYQSEASGLPADICCQPSGKLQDLGLSQEAAAMPLASESEARFAYNIQEIKME
jgi:hypothetical protein